MPATFFKTNEAENLINLCVDIIAYQNDVYSFNEEQSKGEDGHNAVRILMEQHGVGPQQATYQLGTDIKDLIDQFVAIADDLPSLENGTEIGHLRTLRDGCVSWIGMEVWTRITNRYGMQYLDQNRPYTLMPKKHSRSFDLRNYFSGMGSTDHIEDDRCCLTYTQVDNQEILLDQTS